MGGNVSAPLFLNLSNSHTMNKLKVLKVTNPETKRTVIRPKLVKEDGTMVRVLKIQGDESYLPLLKKILNGDVTVHDCTILEHEEYGEYAVISSIEEITRIEDLDLDLV